MLSEKRLQALRLEIEEVNAFDALTEFQNGSVLVDVRETDEVAKGSPLGAVRLGRAFFEFKIETVIPDSNADIIVLCASGGRSLFAADSLKKMGYENVKSLRGGFSSWQDAGLPIEAPRTLTNLEQERYARHLMIPEVGEAGQLKLLSSKVALVGAGGLGSPIAYYLAAAGVGTLGLIDDDHIERSNLQRQILHTEDRIGTSKGQSAKETLQTFSPDININLHEVRLDSSNVEDVLSGYDLVIDGTDNLPTRYLVNDACVNLKIPEVFGAIFRFEGQLTVFWPAGPRGGPCYRCLFPEPPPMELAPSCAEAGVMGVLPGIMGTLMGMEALKILIGMGEPMIGRLLNYDGLHGTFQELQIAPDPNCRLCSEGAEKQPYIDYAHFCKTG